MTWSICTPSSRVCTRTVCGPPVANGTCWLSEDHQLPPDQPQPDTPHSKHPSRLKSRPPVVPMRWAGSPLSSTASENCIQMESFHFESLAARRRTQTRYDL